MEDYSCLPRALGVNSLSDSTADPLHGGLHGNGSPVDADDTRQIEWAGDLQQMWKQKNLAHIFCNSDILKPGASPRDFASPTCAPFQLENVASHPRATTEEEVAAGRMAEHWNERWILEEWNCFLLDVTNASLYTRRIFCLCLVSLGLIAIHDFGGSAAEELLGRNEVAILRLFETCAQANAPANSTISGALHCLAVFRGLYEAAKGNMHLLLKDHDPTFSATENLKLCSITLGVDCIDKVRQFDEQAMWRALSRAAVIGPELGLTKLSFATLKKVCRNFLGAACKFPG